MSGTFFLDADEIRAATFVQQVEVHDTLDSTNDRAAELAHGASTALPALVATRLQTAGRGRGNNAWWSADGALTFSLLLEPAAIGIQAWHWPQLSLATAVAVCDALADELRDLTQAPLGIKWPNDVLLDGQKICGILIESPGGPVPAKNRLIIGVGVNVNNSWRAAPRAVHWPGTALIDVTGTRHSLQGLLIATLQAIERRMIQCSRHDPIVSKRWRELCMLAGRNVCVETAGQVIKGQCLGIAADGSLVVETADGQRSAHSGTVRAMA